MSSHYPTPNRSSSSTLLVVGLIAVVLVGAHWIPAPSIQSASTSSPGSSVQAVDAAGRSQSAQADATPNPVAQLADEQANAIEQLIAEEPGLFGIVLIDSAGDTSYQQNADLPFVSASLYKLVLLADIFAGIEADVVEPSAQIVLLPEYFPAEGDFEDSYFPATWINEPVMVEQLLFAAGAYSSNVAAQALLSLTSAADLTAMARALGMADTHFFIDLDTSLEWPPDQPSEIPDANWTSALAFVQAEADGEPVNVTTPRDTATYFQKLLAGEVSAQSTSTAIIDILKEQVVVDRIPMLLPAGTEVAHKTGNLDHVVHDAGIIWTPDGPVILVAMIEDSLDDVVATELIQRIALIAYGQTQPYQATPETITID